MKSRIITIIISAVIFAAAAAGCSGSSGSGTGIDQNGQALFPGTPLGTEQSVTQTPSAQQTSTYSPTPTQTANGFVGSWQHTYEYYGNIYHTTLVIDQNGSAAFYNEEAELGNFSASWQATPDGTGITVTRSDGVVSTCTIQGNTLTEITVENGSYYQADYQRIS